MSDPRRKGEVPPRMVAADEARSVAAAVLITELNRIDAKVWLSDEERAALRKRVLATEGR